MHILSTIAVVYIFSMTWGLLQERIASVPYYTSPAAGSTGELFPSFLALNLLQSLVAWAVSGALVRRLSTAEREKLPPLRAFLRISVLHTSASPIMYTALSFIAYPHVTLISSVKLVPMMVAGYVMNGRVFGRKDVACAALMTAGVLLYSLEKAMGAPSSSSSASAASLTGTGGGAGADPTSSSSSAASWVALLSPAALSASLPPALRVTLGVSLVLLNLTFDGLVGAAQDAVNAEHRGGRGRAKGAHAGRGGSAATSAASAPASGGGPSISPVYMMHGQNGWAAALLGVYLLADGVLSGGDGQLPRALSFVTRHPHAALHAAGFALCGSASQVAIFSSLSSHGSFTTTSVTLSRKFFSILLSTLVYRHALSYAQWVGIACVFAGLSVQISAAAAGVGGVPAGPPSEKKRRDSGTGGTEGVDDAESGMGSVRARGGGGAPPLPVAWGQFYRVGSGSPVGGAGRGGTAASKEKFV